MTERENPSPIVIGATDVRLRELGESRYALSTGVRRFVLSMDPADWVRFRHVVGEIVPRLRRSEPLGRLLPAAEAALLRPYLDQLTSMGVLLRPRCGVDTDAELGLYTFVARRTESPDEVFALVKEKRIAVPGDDPFGAELAAMLARQGLTVDDRDPALTVTVSCGDHERLEAENRRLCEEGRASLPVLFLPRRVRVGPWTRPGESACLRCLGPGGEDTPPTSPESWLSRQPGCAGWVGGLVTHLALHAFVPMGADHPWGRVTTLDVATGEQDSVRVWRDPYCADCAVPAAAAQAWVEV